MLVRIPSWLTFQTKIFYECTFRYALKISIELPPHIAKKRLFCGSLQIGF